MGECLGIGILRVGVQPDQQARRLSGLGAPAPVNDLAQVGVHTSERGSLGSAAPPSGHWETQVNHESADSGRAP